MNFLIINFTHQLIISKNQSFNNVNKICNIYNSNSYFQAFCKLIRSKKY